MLKFNCYLPRLFMLVNKVKFGKKLKCIGWPFVFRFPRAKLQVGDNCRINSNFWSNLLGLYQRTIIVAKGRAEITIGNHVGISGATIYAREKISIGDNTLVGANVKIVDNDFHPIDSEARLKHQNEKVKSRPVEIGQNVFIGMNSIILKGTVLGNNCVVGAGSVVSGRFEDNCVIAGNPARVIKVLEPMEAPKEATAE